MPLTKSLAPLPPHLQELENRHPVAQAQHPVQSTGSQDSIPQIIWRRKWTVILLCAICLATAFTYLQKATPLYRSSARVYVEQRNKQMLHGDPSALANTDGFLALQCELLRSDSVLSLAPETPILRALRDRGIVITPAMMKAGLQAEFSPKDGIVTITYDSPRAEETADIINATIDAYVAFQDRSSTTNTTELLNLLQGQKSKREQEMADAQSALTEFRKRHRDLGATDEKGSIILERLAKISDAMSAAELRALEAISLMDSVTAVQNNPDGLLSLMQAERAKQELPPDDVGDQLRAAMSNLQEQLTAATFTSGDKNPRVESLRHQIEHLRGEIAAHDAYVLKNFPEIVRQKMVLAQQNANDLKAAFDEEQKSALDLNFESAQLLRLESTVSRCEKLSDMLDDRIKEVQINQEVEGVRVGVLERAAVPDAPAYPQKAKTLAAAGLMGLILGVGCALMRNWVDKRIRSSEEIHAALRVPVLGVVPRISGRRTFAEAGQSVHLDPRSTFAEAYRAIRTGVFFGTAGAHGKKLVITSPESGDGKTMTVSNLAIAIAQAGQRTLVIDADLRNPAQHKVFAIDNEIGLVDVLLGSASLKEAIVTTEVSNLHVLPSGPVPMNPSEILSGQSFTALLEELANRYDYVIIDSPPVLSVTDAGILGALCDMTILVLRWNRSTAKMGQDARDVLLSVGARIFGGIVNDVPRSYGRPNYYYGTPSRREPLAAPVTPARQMEAGADRQ